MLARSSLLASIALLFLLLTVGGWLWPLRWHYWTLSPRDIQAQQAQLPGPLLYGGKPVTEFRENRITHELQDREGENWVHARVGISH